MRGEGEVMEGEETVEEAETGEEGEERRECRLQIGGIVHRK